jgi:dynein heavy chain, axonemal
VLEQQLEKKAGRTYAPVGKYKLIYFIDDLNMPALDPYNTQTAISLLRQHKDYEHWYDRTKLTLKDIKNTLYTACMNPTAGSFQINPAFSVTSGPLLFPSLSRPLCSPSITPS